MRFRFMLAAFGLSLLCGCHSLRTVEDTSPPAPYVRLANTDSNLVQLQVALRRLTPDVHRRGPALWLMGVSHLGESNYYARLQKELDARTVVLFEGVGAKEDQEGEGAPAPAERSSHQPDMPGHSHSSLQSSMASALGLVFQLDALDYDRTNFQHCDLSVEQIRKLIAEQPPITEQPGAGPGFESLLQLMQGNSWFDSLVRLGLSFVGNNPKLQGLAKLALIETLAELQGDPSNLSALPPDMKQLLDVLLQKRNEQVLGSLKIRLKRSRRADSIAVFYGAGHMADLQRRVCRELHYHPTEQLWLTAFAVDLRRAGINPAEHAFIRGLIQTQLGRKDTTPPPPR